MMRAPKSFASRSNGPRRLFVPRRSFSFLLLLLFLLVSTLAGLFGPPAGDGAQGKVYAAPSAQENAPEDDAGMVAPFAQGAEREPEPPPAGPPDVVPNAERGLQIYGERCASCHGPYGRGRGEMLDRLPAPPPSFADPAYMREVTPLEAFQVVTNGRLERLMPPWRDALSAQERWDVVYGAWSFHYRPDALVAGRDAFQSNCAACHGLGAADPGATDSAAADSAAAETASDRTTATVDLSDAAWWFDKSQRDAFDAYLGLSKGVGDGEGEGEREGVGAGDGDREGEAGIHAPLEELDAETLWAALDYARSTTFEPLPFEDLRLDGEIRGSVVNASAGETEVAGTRVTLVPFHERTAGILPSTPISSSVDADGRFAFAGLLAGPGISYRTVASYRGADIIQEDRIPLGGDAPALAEPELKVYAPSTSVELRARQVQIAVSPDPTGAALSVAEAWAIVNPSDRLAVATEDGPLLRFPIPSDAQGLVFEDPRMNEAFERDAEGASLDLPLPPGESLIVLAYGLPWTGRELDVDRALPLPISNLHLIAVGETVEIESELLLEQRSEQRGDQRVLDASATDLGAGSRLQARIVGLPEPPSTGTMQAPSGMQPLPPAPLSREQLMWIALLASLLMGVALLVLPGSSTRRAGVLRAEREALVRELADLDARLEAGSIAAEEHRSRRVSLVERALDLMRAERRAKGRAGGEGAT